MFRRVTEMLDYEARTQQRVDAAELKIARNYVDNMKTEHPDIDYNRLIKKAATILGLDDGIVLKLNETYMR